MSFPRCPSLFACLLLALAAPAHAIVGGTPTTAFGQVSNGVQIAPNWVLTARHVGYAVGGGYANGYGASTVAARYDAIDAGVPFPTLDLALLRLATPIAAPALSLNSSILAESDAYAIPATMVTAQNQAPRGYAPTTVREFAPKADPDDEGPKTPVDVMWLVSYPDGFGAPYVQSGDSGGALFIGHVSDALTPLWGITSAQLYDEDEQGQRSNFRSAFVQLGNFRSWIDTTMSADLADTQLAAWVQTSAVPEASPATLLVLGLLALLRLCGRRNRLA
ncbi:trypsin-like serine protease [Roseateles violae]|uniref:Trypsin-like serine protease n=1 Tax=Roseateles violae TaxID=3058042 RepID=A0ABT8DPT2_9BURK|nr:trypsin-like serine protease [Pelomonas sp. PFR6]MDN3919093.1 trypsin-like serine protease [Pelomonas sp. PFR6]